MKTHAEPELLDDLLTVWERLAAEERELVAIFASRLLWGQGHYGKFADEGPRDYPKEAIEEALDGFVYSARMMQRARETSAQPIRRRAGRK